MTVYPFPCKYWVKNDFVVQEVNFDKNKYIFVLAWRWDLLVAELLDSPNVNLCTIVHIVLVPGLCIGMHFMYIIYRLFYFITVAVT